MMLIADPHWGKAATFRAGGIPVPGGTTVESIRRLDDAIDRTDPLSLVFLGDMLHAKEGRSDFVRDSLLAWRKRRPTLNVILVRGNHDRHAGDPPAELDIECVDAPYAVRPFVFVHHPTRNDAGYVIAGHVHPGVKLAGAGRQRERLPCFLIGEESAILPAFGEFTGMADVEPAEADMIFAAAGDTVTRVYCASSSA